MTDILKADHPECISAAVSTLKRGFLVVYPTDTVYGLGALATDIRAVQRLFPGKEKKPQTAIADLAGRHLRDGTRGFHVAIAGAAISRKFLARRADNCPPRLSRFPEARGACRKGQCGYFVSLTSRFSGRLFAALVNRSPAQVPIYPEWPPLLPLRVPLSRLVNISMSPSTTAQARRQSHRQ